MEAELKFVRNFNLAKKLPEWYSGRNKNVDTGFTQKAPKMLNFVQNIQENIITHDTNTEKRRTTCLCKASFVIIEMNPHTAHICSTTADEVTHPDFAIQFIISNKINSTMNMVMHRT